MNRHGNLLVMSRIYPPLLLAVALCVGSSATAQVIFVPDRTPQVSVSGLGTVEVAPDLAKVTLGVYILDPNLRQAKQGVDKSVGRLLDLAESQGIQPTDISSSAANIEPSYSEAETPEFIGYEVTRSVNVTIRDLSRLDQLIDAAIEAGANREFSVRLESSKIREIEAQAMALAIEDAKAKARQLAEGFGAKLGAIRSVGPKTNSSSTSYMAAYLSYGRGVFQPGTITVKSEISATFLLEP